MSFLDRILPWRAQIRRQRIFISRLNSDCQELADRLHESKETLRALVDIVEFRNSFWHEYGDRYPDIKHHVDRRRALLARIDAVLSKTTPKKESN